MAFRPKDIHVQYLVVVLIKLKTPNWPRETVFILLCQKSLYFLLAPLIIHWYLSHYIDIRPAIQKVTHSAEFQDSTFTAYSENKSSIRYGAPFIIQGKLNF